MTYKAVIYSEAFKDDYTKGESDHRDNSWEITLERDTPEELKEAICNETYSLWADIMHDDVNEYDEQSEYWASYMTNKENIGEANEEELSLFRKGKLQLWAVNCHILVSKITESKVIL